MADAIELNLDGLVGATHNYAGLSHGNLASGMHAATPSHPRQAALQGLTKMKLLHDLGVRQAVLPPPLRPRVDVLRRLGFSGDDETILRMAAREAPRLLAAVYSASAMWAANAATISPSVDSEDRRVHFSPANMITQFHRSIEPDETAARLRQIFPGPQFAHHDPFPAADALADEGAANHFRLSSAYGEPGLEAFVYGRDDDSKPAKFPGRQTKEACAAVARRHGLADGRVLILQQSPKAIDAGAFHNDVVVASNQNVLLAHGEAFAAPDAIERIRERFIATAGSDLCVFVADPEELTLADAVSTYLFNSQIVTLPDQTMAVIAPIECREHPGVQRYLKRVTSGVSPVRAVHYVDLRQSMHNGGGPACLRLRVVLTPEQLRSVHSGVIFDDELYCRLIAWVENHYRESLTANDLKDPKLLEETADAAQSLSAILNLD